MREKILVKPSESESIANQFGTIVSYFPENCIRAAELTEGIFGITGEKYFSDQYVSSAGQMIELATGRDAFVCDLRAKWNRMGGSASASAKPYDLAAAPIAKAAGVLLTDSDGGAFDAPFSVGDEMSWCGYANQHIRAIIEPIILRYT